MVQLIGLKRLIFLGVAILLNAAFAGAFFLWVEPMRLDNVKELRGLNGSISRLRGEIEGIKKEMEELERNKVYYEGLKAVGFFQPQDRFYLEKQVAQLKDQTSVVGYEYQIDELQKIPENMVAQAKHELLNSRIHLSNVRAYSDKDIYGLIHEINTKFPGQTRLHELDIKKKEIDDKMLNSIRNGGKEVPITAKIVFDWQTMVPIIDKNNNNADGFGNYFGK